MGLRFVGGLCLNLSSLQQIVVAGGVISIRVPSARGTEYEYGLGFPLRGVFLKREEVRIVEGVMYAE